MQNPELRIGGWSTTPPDLTRPSGISLWQSSPDFQLRLAGAERKGNGVFLIYRGPNNGANTNPKNPVEQSGSGKSCDTENIEQIAKSMHNLSQKTADELSDMGQASKDWLMNNQTVERQVLAILERLQRR